MKKTTLMAGTSPFAHLLGGAAALAGRALGRRADEEELSDVEDDDDADAEDEEKDEPETGKKGRKGKKAEKDGDEDEAEEDSDDADAEDEDEDEEDDEPKGKRASTSYKRGFAASNKRARAIFAAPAAAGRPDLAAQLAFETSMSAAEAIGVLAAAGTPAPNGRSRSLDDRMGSRTEPRPGAGGGREPGKASFGERAKAAAKKAGVSVA